MNRKNAVIAVLFVLLLLSSSSSYLAYQQQQRIISLQQETIEKLISASRTRAGTESGSESGTENGTGTERAFEQALNESEGVSVSYANIVAVSSYNNLGVLGKVRVELKDGGGNVLVNTNPFVEPVTQYSVREAVKVAENFTNANCSDKDIVVSFEITGNGNDTATGGTAEVGVVGGPSAGAAITLATIAALEGKGRRVRQDAVVTGTIEEGGRIGKVGAVFDKAVAAEENGIRLFLVPSGQKNLTYYEQKIVEREWEIFGIRILVPKIYYTEKKVDLGKYMQGKMQVAEVSTIDEVVEFMIS